MIKAQDQRSLSMKEQAYNNDKDQDQDSRAQQQHNLNDLTSGEIVSLKILSQTWNLSYYLKVFDLKLGDVEIEKIRILNSSMEYKERDEDWSGRPPKALEWKERYKMDGRDKIVLTGA
nr:hypothetical protein [Tanacetum cinerariifolium]